MANTIGRIGHVLKDALGVSSVPIKNSKLTSGTVIYSHSPVPFALPATNGSIPFETLRYSATMIEEIMYVLSEELKARGYSGMKWKKYFRMTTEEGANKAEYTWIYASKNGTQLSSSPVKFFPQYCSDIMDVIEALVADTTVPDSLLKMQARNFANYTSVNGNVYNENNQLTSNVWYINPVIEAGSEQRKTMIDPISNINADNWAFDLDYIKRCVPIMGVTPKGIAQVQNTPGSLEVSDTNWPQSVIGLTTSSGIAGFDVPMTRANGPFIDHVEDDGDVIMQIKQHVSNTSTGKGAGQVDYDQGYGYLAHFPHVVEQLRYRPPKVEFFPENVRMDDWQSPIYSNTHPDLNWYFSKPTMTNWPQNLGAWIIKGYGGVQNKSLYLKAYANGGVNTTGNCPYNFLYPTATSTCTCLSTDTAYAIWYARDSGFVWEGEQWWQTNRAFIPFGPKTKLIITGTGTSGDTRINDEEGSQTWIGIGIRTSRISASVMFQPFYYIHEGSVNCSISLQNKLASLIEGYRVGGIDHVLALGIFLTSKNKVIEIRNAADGPNGSYIPGTPPSCSCPTLDATITSIEFCEDYLYDPVSGYPALS